jgi:hypothetical protein
MCNPFLANHVVRYISQFEFKQAMKTLLAKFLILMWIYFSSVIWNFNLEKALIMYVILVFLWMLLASHKMQYSLYYLSLLQV